MTAWFLIITICANAPPAPTECADLLASGAPFYDKVSCLNEGARQTQVWMGMAYRVEYHCEEWPLER